MGFFTFDLWKTFKNIPGIRWKVCGNLAHHAKVIMHGTKSTESKLARTKLARTKMTWWNGEFSELHFHIPSVLDGLMLGMFLKAFQRSHRALLS